MNLQKSVCDFMPRKAEAEPQFSVVKAVKCVHETCYGREIIDIAFKKLNDRT